MKIVYTSYAEESIADRKLDKSIIGQTLLKPDEIVEGKFNRFVAHKIVRNKLLRVVYEVEDKTYIVATAYYTDIKRYFGK